MRKLTLTLSDLKLAIPVLFPIGVWTMLFASIGPGDPGDILRPGNPTDFFHGVRAVLPVVAASIAATMIGFGLLHRIAPGFGFLGPLGLATAYGLVGVIAAIKSPDGSVAMWWTVLYLTVPVVLLGLIWGADPLERIQRLVNLTWLFMILAAGILFAIAAIYLDLIDQIKDPAQLLKCPQAGWFDLTSQRIRSSGVGRYAALAAIIALSGLWQTKWRPVWAVVLVPSLALLIYSSSRGAFVAFAAGAALVVLVYLATGGKRSMVTGMLVVLVLVPIFWATGAHHTFLENCIFPGSGTSTVSAPPPSEAGEQPLVVRTPEPGSPSATLESDIPPGTTPAGGVLPAPAAISKDGTATSEQTPVARTPGGSSPSATLESVPSPDGTLVGGVQQTPAAVPGNGLVTKEFFEFTGRKAVWEEALSLIKDSPIIGFGFHADRLLLSTHMHNSILHATLQTGLLGGIPFVAAMILAWALFIRMLRRLALLSGSHKHLVIQCGGVLAFLTMRSFPESTGAFFGVDWLILAPILFYLQLLNGGHQSLEVNSDDRRLERV